MQLFWTLISPNLGTLESTALSCSREITRPHLESCYMTELYLKSQSAFPHHAGLFCLNPAPLFFPLLSLRYGIIQARTSMWAPPPPHCPWGHLFSIIWADWSHARCESRRVGGCLHRVWWVKEPSGACGCQWRNKASNLAPNGSNAKMNGHVEFHYDHAV